MFAWAIDYSVVSSPLAVALAVVLFIRFAVALAERREKARGRQLLKTVDRR
jgi:hypothetical protein